MLKKDLLKEQNRLLRRQNELIERVIKKICNINNTICNKDEIKNYMPYLNPDKIEEFNKIRQKNPKEVQIFSELLKLYFL